ncbi:MAG: ImmA/IrrE family metallo-endopeptidase [Deltaproteobacteria bacterium]|nr:ImmA/IrrE family metallo-endopeptidase [Deltaproteobacteria bacterium]
MPDKELASRLKSARESAGLPLIEAAKRLGYANYQTLSSIENAEREVKASELVKLAQIYFCNIQDLLDQGRIRQNFPFLWRNPPKTEGQRKETESKIFFKCEQYHLLEKLLNIKPEKGFIETSIEDIRNNHALNLLATKTRDLLGLGSRPAFTLPKVLEENYGVKILYLPLDQGSAVSMVHEECGRTIIINAKEVPWRRNYDLAHEFFHLILWKTLPPEQLKDHVYFMDIEKRAEKFASMLLLPEEEIRQETISLWESQKKVAYSDLVDIAMDFGVSTKALLYRYAHLKFIDWETADKIAHDEELAELSREKRWAEKEAVKVSTRFITLAMRCLRKGLISRGTFAEMVEIDRPEIDDFIKDSGLMESEGNAITIENLAS